MCRALKRSIVRSSFFASKSEYFHAAVASLYNFVCHQIAPVLFSFDYPERKERLFASPFSAVNTKSDEFSKLSTEEPVCENDEKVWVLVKTQKVRVWSTTVRCWNILPESV